MSIGSRYLSIVLLAISIIGLATSCSTKNGTEVNALVDPIKIDTGYISGTVIGDVGKEVRILSRHPLCCAACGRPALETAATGGPLAAGFANALFSANHTAGHNA